MSGNLDALLSRPLPEIADNGFSNRVMVEMELRQLRRGRLGTEILIGLVVLAVLVLPFTGAGRFLAASASTTAGMALVSLAFGTIGIVFALSAARR